MRFTRKIIGFRSERRKNKVIALIGYFLFFVVFMVQATSGPTPRDSFVHTLAWTLLFLSIIMPVANTFSIRKKLFFFNRLSKLGKFFGILSYAVLSLIIFGMIASGLESATAKQLEAKQQTEQLVAAKSAQDSKIKVQAEAQAKAEAEAKAKAQQEAQVKAQQEAQAKAEQEAQAKAEQEAQAKAQADAQAKAEQEAQAKAQQEAQVKAQQEAQAKAQQEAQAKAEQEAQAKAQAQQATVQILSVSDPAPRNSIATLTAKVAPNATAEIAVHYESGDSTAQGLGPEQADANGNVSWSWHVGGRTTLGTWPITVSCNGASADTQFTVLH